MINGRGAALPETSHRSRSLLSGAGGLHSPGRCCLLLSARSVWAARTQKTDPYVKVNLDTFFEVLRYIYSMRDTVESKKGPRRATVIPTCMHNAQA